MRVSKPPQERRAELVAAARALFDERGIEKTRVSDIVGRVGVAQGVFYYYFSSKEEMVEAVVEQVSAEISARMDALLAANTPFCQKLAEYIELYIDVIDQFLADGATSLRTLENSAVTHSFLASQGQQQLGGRLEELVAQGIAGGDITAAYPAQTALVLLYGLRRYAADELPTRHMLYTIVEQCLGLPAGCLVNLAPPP